MRVVDEEQFLAVFSQGEAELLERLREAYREVAERVERLERDSRRYLKQTQGGFSSDDLSRLLGAHLLWESKRSILGLRMEGVDVGCEEKERLFLRALVARHLAGEPFKPREVEILRKAASTTQNPEGLVWALARLEGLERAREEKTKEARDRFGKVESGIASP